MGRWWLPPSLNCDESCEFVYAHGSFVHQKCYNYALTNLLFGLCKFIWIIDLLVIRLRPHPEAWTHPFHFEVLWVKERTPTPSVVFVFKLAFESFKEFKVVSSNFNKCFQIIGNLNQVLLISLMRHKKGFNHYYIQMSVPE